MIFCTVDISLALPIDRRNQSGIATSSGLGRKKDLEERVEFVSGDIDVGILGVSSVDSLAKGNVQNRVLTRGTH